MLKFSCRKLGLPFPAADVVGVRLSCLDSFVTLPLLLACVFLIPFAAEVESSSQTYNQQTHTENGHNNLLFSHWLNNELRVATPGAVEAPLTLAVVLVDVHQQHALAIVHAVAVKSAVAVLC